MIPAVLDERLAARVVGRTPLRYRDGPDPALDRPAVVRSASALTWVGRHLVVVQDDAAFLGVVELATGLVDDVPLPRGPGGARTFDAVRGNKADKPDLEAVFVAGGELVALGSGGPLAPRRRVVAWRPGEAPRVLPAPRLYDALDAAVATAGWPLNLEGAAVAGADLLLAQRGGPGAPDVLLRLDLARARALLAAPEEAALPGIEARACDLGSLGEVPLHLTDLAPGHDATVYLAAAEGTSSWFHDGAVAGSVVGVLAGRMRHAPVLDERGDLAVLKAEGVAVLPGRPDRLLVVTDPDDPDGCSELIELSLAGPWWPGQAPRGAS